MIDETAQRNNPQRANVVRPALHHSLAARTKNNLRAICAPHAQRSPNFAAYIRAAKITAD
jgi:hypothetical protein